MSCENAPIACTLTGHAMAERLVWIRDLGQRALIDRNRNGPVLSLHFDPAHGEDVHEFVRRERACCGFLDFAVAETADAIHVTITVPHDALDIADEVLGYFTPYR